MRASKLLRDDIEKYTKLTGEDGWHVPIMKVGAYLDGYDKGLEVLDEIRAEIDLLSDSRRDGTNVTLYTWDGMKRKVFDIIDKYKEESEAEV